MTNSTSVNSSSNIVIENEYLRCVLHPIGAAVSRLIFKPMAVDVVLGFADDQYRTTPRHYINTIVGPVANRIAGGCMHIDGQEYRLQQNEGENTLHSGTEGFSKILWNIAQYHVDSVTFQHHMPDGYAGFAGAIDCAVIYSLTATTLNIEIIATSPKTVAINFAPHLYFNLMGTGDTANHHLRVHASRYVAVNDQKIPTGALPTVHNTALDFLERTPIAARAFDHTLCLEGEGLRPALWLDAPNGLQMHMSTNQAGVQIYDARSMGKKPFIDHQEQPFRDRGAIAIEPQGWPDAIRHDHFPSILLRPPETYRHISAFTFGRRMLKF